MPALVPYRRRIVRARRSTTGRPLRSRKVSRARSRVPTGRIIHSFSRWGTPSSYNNISAPLGGLRTDSNCSYDSTRGIVITSSSLTGSIREIDLTAVFSLGQMPNVADFQSLYDMYRIKAIKFQIKLLNVPEGPSGPNSNVSNLYANYYPTIWYAPDQDDVNLSTIQQLREFRLARHKVLRPNSIVNIYMKPNPLQLVFNGVQSSYTPMGRNKWVDMADISVPYYGLKMAIDFEGQSISTINQWSFKIDVKYYFQCKNIR